MTNNKPTNPLETTYKINQITNEVKIVFAKKEQRKAKDVSSTKPTRFALPRYSFDDNGGGYKGL